MLDARSLATSTEISYEWVRKFTAGDIEGMVSLLNDVVRTSGTNGYSKALTDEEGRKLASGLELAIHRDEAAQLLCRDVRGEIVGMGTLLRHKQPDRRHVIEISRVAISPDQRGRFLLEAWQVILHRAEEMGACLLDIDVSEDGPTRLWRQLGFTTWGVMKDYARVGERRLDGYYMSVYIEEARERIRRGRTRVR